MAFSAGYTIDSLKWDSIKRMVRANTTHLINGKTVYAREINNIIRNILETIEEAFTEYSLHNEIPASTDLKELVNEKLGRGKKELIENVHSSLKEIFKEFLKARALEGNWSIEARYKYDQVWQQLTGCDPKIELNTLDKDKMMQLCKWYIENDYCNRTILKQIGMLKSFLRWTTRNGYTIQPGVLEFKPKLKVIPKTVTFLKFKELMHFYHFEFPEEKEYLSKARDMFCFMAFTSLRYSDLAALRPVNVVDGYLDICTEKTDDRLHISLNEYAQEIIDKYSWYKGATVFQFPAIRNLMIT